MTFNLKFTGLSTLPAIFLLPAVKSENTHWTENSKNSRQKQTYRQRRS